MEKEQTIFQTIRDRLEIQSGINRESAVMSRYMESTDITLAANLRITFGRLEEKEIIRLRNEGAINNGD